MNSKKLTPPYWSASGWTSWLRKKRPSGPVSALAPSKGRGTPHGQALMPLSPLSPPARILLASMLVASALLLVTGCSTSRGEVVRTEIVRVEVPVQKALPEDLLRDCLPAAEGGTTIEEIAEWAEDLVLTLEACNEDKAEIRGLQP